MSPGDPEYGPAGRRAVSVPHAIARRLKRVLRPSVWSLARALGTAVFTPFRFSLRTGHFRSSLRALAVDRHGAPLPWYTYPAIDFLSQRSFGDLHVLEFGGGQSTLWWGSRARSVLTIEEDEAWAASLGARLPGHVAVRHVPVDGRTRDIAGVLAALAAWPVDRFDIIVIDGHLRGELVPVAFDRLADGGALIVDNAEGYGFFECVRTRDCARVDFYGFCPGTSLRSVTSIAWRGHCRLFAPDAPIVMIEVADGIAAGGGGAPDVVSPPGRLA